MDQIQNRLNYQEIKDRFLDLDASKKKQLVNMLSFGGRLAILNFKMNHGNDQIKESTLKELNDKISEVKNLIPEITRKDDRRTISYFLNKNIEKISNKFFKLIHSINTYSFDNSIKDFFLKELSKETTIMPEISEEELKALIEGLNGKDNTDVKFDLAKILGENGFSSEIRDHNFSINPSFKNMNLEGIEFYNCTFDWTKCSGSILKNVKFIECEINNLSLMNATLKNCSFEDCDIREVMFTCAMLEDVHFNRSSLISCSFEDTTLLRCEFYGCRLPATHFLEANVVESSLFNCVLRDAVFFKTLNQFSMDEQTKSTIGVTRPTVAFIVDPEKRGISVPKAYMKLDQSSHVIPLRITIKPQMVPKEGVNEEVEAILRIIGTNDGEEISIVKKLLKEILKDPESENAKILKKAEKIAFEVDAFFLPGGEDIPPALYGQKQDEKTEWDGDYRRSILELGFIHQSFNKGIPLMAICRGFQMSYIYFGAQLVQNIEGHKGLQSLVLNRSEIDGLYAEAMKNNIISVSFHHQAVLEKAAPKKHLEPSVVYKGVVKAAELKASGSVPMILLQFHPEFNKALSADSLNQELIDMSFNVCMSNKNEVFWNILSCSARAYRIKKIALRQLQPLIAP